MLNLLPLNKKKKIQTEYNIRRAVLAMAFGTLAVIIGITFLLPTFLLARAKYNDLNEKDLDLTAQLNLQKNQETNFTEKEKAMLDVLEKNTSTLLSPTSFINAVIGAKGLNITLTDFSIVTDEEVNKLLIHGRAVAREDLITFKQALEKNKLWSGVELPISDLGPARSNAFTITLTIAK